MKKAPFERPAQELRAFYRGQVHRLDPVRSARMRRLKEMLILPPLPGRRRARGSIWGVSMVKNEADIIGPVVEHLFRQGMDAALIADNGSSDDTPALLSRLASDHPLYVAQDREPAKYHGAKITLLADVARRAGADWIIPFDADEFWFASEGTLGDFLRSCRADIVRASIHNLFPVGDVAFGEGQWLLDKIPHFQGKVAFRSHRYALVGEGNHWVKRPGLTTDGLKVLHVPWRSYDQFRRKTVQGMEARSLTSLSPGIGHHLRYLGALSEEEARAVWRGILHREAPEEIVWRPHGPAEPVDPTQWSTWDPDHLLAPAQDSSVQAEA